MARVGIPVAVALDSTVRSFRAVPCSFFNASGFLGRPRLLLVMF
jgi:hypothetical protein